MGLDGVFVIHGFGDSYMLVDPGEEFGSREQRKIPIPDKPGEFMNFTESGPYLYDVEVEPGMGLGYFSEHSDE